MIIVCVITKGRPMASNSNNESNSSILSNFNIDPATNSITKTIGNDLYIAAKNWLSQLDPTGEKLLNYREGILASLGSIQIMGMQKPRRLNKLYIALRTLPNLRCNEQIDENSIFDQETEKNIEKKEKFSLFRHGKEVDRFIKDIGYGDILLDDEDRELESSKTKKSKAKCHKKEKFDGAETVHGLEAINVINDSKNTLVLGQPGSGKTTFLKYLGLAYSGLAPAPNQLPPLLPIFVPLREMKRVDAPVPTANWLLTFILSCASEVSGAAFNEEWLKQYLKRKECLILLDGIDEVDPELVKDIVRSIVAFSKKYRGNKFVVTCRAAAFNYQAEGFVLCEIDDFNDEDVSIFISQWFEGDADKENDLKQLLKESKVSKELCKTPLLLTMVCILYEYNQNIPNNRFDLYQTCVDALFFRWDSFRFIKRPSLTQGLSTSRKKMILARIARKTFDNDVYYFKKETLVNMLKSELQRSNLLQINPEFLLTELESHNGLFIERASKVYTFSHLTFQEYFTALAYSEDNSLQELLNLVISEHRYREVFLMALERSYEPDKICIELASFIKYNIINIRITSKFFIDLLTDITHSDISINPKIRTLLGAVLADLFISDVVKCN